MFSLSAHLYDAIYLSRGKDYEADALSVHELAKENLRSGGNSLLDVACGTGIHLSYLKNFLTARGWTWTQICSRQPRRKCPK